MPKRAASTLTLTLLIATLLTAGCDGGAESEDAAPADPTQGAVVRIERSRFEPAELRVPLGTTVRFVNDDPYAHTVTSSSSTPISFDSGGLAEGDEFEVTFDEPGEYAYHCEVHPTMRARVAVG